MNFPQVQEPPPFKLNRIDGGFSNKYIESQINDNQSPYMLNLTADDRGALGKRDGQAYVYETSLGASGINGIASYKGIRVIAHGTKLYTQSGSYNPVEIYSGLANAKAAFFIVKDILYMINGTDYIKYNGVTVSKVEDDSYIPTLLMNGNPAGGGETLEDLNLLGNGFKISYTADGTSYEYVLPFTGLDTTTVKIDVNGDILTEGTHFTVDRTLGKVNFNGGTSPYGPPVNPDLADTVLITAYKTFPGKKELVKKCLYPVLYGGDNDTRVFVADGNTMRWSGVYDPSYWPENGFKPVGNDESIFGFGKQYDALIVLKERSIEQANYSIDSDGKVSFPTKPIHSSIGCDMPYTIQLINNNLVWCNSYAGVYMLVSTQLKDERNVVRLSENINGAEYRLGLLDENNLEYATSVDYKGKYWLCINHKAYVWDYVLTPFSGNEDNLSWFPMDNINANCWIIEDKTLIYGGTGQLVKFITLKNDFGQPINAYWRSKLFNFNLPEWIKTIQEIWISSRVGQLSQMTLKYYGDNGEKKDEKEIKFQSFSLSNFSLSNFSLYVNRFSKTIRRKCKIKKTVYFQVEVSNNELNQNLSIIDLIIRFTLKGKVKR